MNSQLNRRIKRIASIAVISMALLGVFHGLTQAQMSIKEFEALPDADKRTVLVSTLEERELAVRNLQALSETHLYNVPYRNGKAGTAVLEDFGRYVCEFRRKDGNHWASINWFLPGQPDRPNQKVVTSMDCKSGVAKSVAEQDKLNGVYGAIATEEDLMIRTGRFHYWFDALFDKPQEFPISHLLKHQEAIKFEGLSSDGKEIQISLHIETNNGTLFHDSRTIWIDPQKGFMPVRMKRRWEYKTKPPLYSEIETEVKKMEQIDDIWFPTHFTQTTIGRLSVAEGYASVYETTVSEIKLGTMTDGDLQVTFADGVEVEDRIKGAWFVANKATQSAPPPSKAETTVAARKWWIIVVNIVIGVLAVTVFWGTRRRKLKDTLTR